MARRWSRKRGGGSRSLTQREPSPEPVESVHLDAAENAWWSQSEVERAWRPKARARPESEPKPDILAEHFGADWRTNFGFDAAEVEEPDGLETSPGDARDPYRVLEVEPDATWDEIVAAHRHQARVHHPDRLFGQSDDEKAEGEEQIRVINAAYQELRIRRGM